MKKKIKIKINKSIKHTLALALALAPLAAAACAGAGFVEPHGLLPRRRLQRAFLFLSLISVLLVRAFQIYNCG